MRCTSIGESMQTRRMDTKEYGKMFGRIPTLEEGRALAVYVRGWKVEGEKRRVTRKEKMRLREEIEVGGFHGAKRFVERCQTRECWKTEEPCPEKMETYTENTQQEHFLSS